MTIHVLRRSRPQVLWICGDHHNCAMLHRIAAGLPECDHWFTPYYCDRGRSGDLLRQIGRPAVPALAQETRSACLGYFRRHDLGIDVGGWRRTYDLVVTCSDLIVPRNVRGTRLVGVQDGLVDPERLRSPRRWWSRSPAGLARTGLSGLYDRYCVASDGYRRDFVRRGAPAHRLAVTGLPGYDDVAGQVQPGHWMEGRVLACTSADREASGRDVRRAFIEWALQIADGRRLVFKLDRRENVLRAVTEIGRWAPGSPCVTDEQGDVLAANCEVLITEAPAAAWVGLVMGKETRGYRDLDEIREMLPIQHGRAAAGVASVCREVLGEDCWADAEALRKAS